MATFFNQATLSYRNIVRNSNITEGEIISAISLTKTAVSSSYGAGEGIVYVITLTNGGANDISGVTLTDDLGAYPLVSGTSVTPLDYVQGSLLYYLNGSLQTAPTVSVTAEGLVISGIDVPANGNATVIYEVTANEYAPLAANSSITNTVNATGACDALTASATVVARDEAQLSIAKAVSPAVVTNCGDVTYTFIVQNTGNTEATATDNIVISDVFNPIMNDITVTLNGEPLAEGTGYTYDETTGAFATVPGVITVPAATFTTDTETGTVTTTPGNANLTVSGTI